MKHVAPLRYGVIFKKAFCDPEIFTAFVRDVVGVKIEIDRVETEKEFSPPIGRVQSRFDLFAQDIKNRVIVDIQHERYPDHYHRFLHYHCAALLEQIASAEDYRPPMTVFTIVVLTSGDKHKRDVSVTDFDPKDLKGNSLGETPHKVIYLCPKYVNKDTPDAYKEWMLAIQDTLDGEVEESEYRLPEIRKIFEHIEKDSVSPQERAKMFDEHGNELLQKEQRSEGIAEGIAEGVVKGKIETAVNMVKMGLAAGQIAQATGLPIEDINELMSDM
ncbi:MAG: Rpn family recombination-promoting nuclease/putative transposase [Desulfobacterales bacterium]|nr:Rpn family recombination-promoting nuclease/putative transposase [Desulfobacterales bacterium]